MFGIPNIVIVDNEEKELETIRDAFFKAGIPCLPIKYINDDPDNQSGIDHIELSNKVTPRIIVSDLNLTAAQNANPTTLVGPLAKVVEKLSITGPYILCIWSKYENDVAEVVKLLEERYKEKIELPIHCSIISKTAFLNEDGLLQERVRNLISENKLFEAILRWESRISEAARSTTNTLYNLAKAVDDTGTISGSALQMANILSEISKQAVGHKNVQAVPAAAIETGLAPILKDQLHSLPEQDLDKIWTDALPALNRAEDINKSVKSKLNSFYHIESPTHKLEKDSRGVFVSLDKGYVDNNPEKFKIRIGNEPARIITEEFIFTSSSNRSLREAARREIILGFLEISPACDHAQRKIKLPKFILGALIPEKYEALTIFKSKDSDGSEKTRAIAHDGIYRLPKINVNNEAYILKLSFKYQIGSQSKDSKWFGEPLFRVREQILAAITAGCSQYASRVGIISFW